MSSIQFLNLFFSPSVRNMTPPCLPDSHDKSPRTSLQGSAKKNQWLIWAHHFMGSRLCALTNGARGLSRVYSHVCVCGGGCVGVCVGVLRCTDELVSCVRESSSISVCAVSFCVCLVVCVCVCVCVSVYVHIQVCCVCVCVCVCVCAHIQVVCVCVCVWVCVTESVRV